MSTFEAYNPCETCPINRLAGLIVKNVNAETEASQRLMLRLMENNEKISDFERMAQGKEDLVARQRAESRTVAKWLETALTNDERKERLARDFLANASENCPGNNQRGSWLARLVLGTSNCGMPVEQILTFTNQLEELRENH